MSDRDTFRAEQTRRPIWLLDVDGVLNAFDDSGPVIGDWSDWETFRTSGFLIRYSPKMVARIRDLHKAGRVEVRWLTTWGSLANGELRRGLGMPELAVAAEMPFRERGEWWKLPVARGLFEQGHAVIWTDDDMPFDSDTGAWLAEVASSDRANELLAIGCQGALSQQEMDEIEKWVIARGE